MSLGHEHGFVFISLAGPMDVVNLSLSLSSSMNPVIGRPMLQTLALQNSPDM